jgi:prevent-host-death family protein
MNTKIIQPNILGLKELRLNIEKYIKLVQKGHSFVVVRKSNPVFKLEPVDKWGDDGLWENVADFTSLSIEGGIPMSDLIKKLKSA